MVGTDGEPLWARSDDADPWLEAVQAMAFDPCGALLLAGTGDAGAADYGRGWLSKIDASGAQIWARSVEAPLPARQETGFVGLAVDADGRAHVVGGLAVELSFDQGFEEATLAPFIGQFSP